MARLNANFAAEWVDDAWAVGSNQTRFGLSLECIHNPNLVLLWDALGDGDNERYFVFDSVDNGVRTRRWRHVENSSIRSRLLYGLQS